MSAPNTRESRTPNVKSFRRYAERLQPPGLHHSQQRWIPHRHQLFVIGNLRGLFYPLLRRLLQERTRKQLRMRPTSE
jgi:hypothetical protein